MKNIMWHIGTRHGTAELQDVVAAAISIGEIDLLSALLNTNRLKGASIESDRSSYLLMYNGEAARPYNEVIVWKCRTEGDESIIDDMGMEDSWIVEYVWRNWLMPEDTDEEYVPPEQFLVMKQA